jgi:hypothetical protein
MHEDLVHELETEAHYAACERADNLYKQFGHGLNKYGHRSIPLSHWHNWLIHYRAYLKMERRARKLLFGYEY